MDISHLVTRVTQTMATHYAALKGKMTVIAGTMLAHVRATNNPHQVDKDQVGLGLVQNYSPATKDVALEGKSNQHYMTPKRTREREEVLLEALTDAFNEAADEIESL